MAASMYRYVVIVGFNGLGKPSTDEALEALRLKLGEQAKIPSANVFFLRA